MFATKLSDGQYKVSYLRNGIKTSYKVNAPDGFSAILNVLTQLTQPAAAVLDYKRL